MLSTSKSVSLRMANPNEDFLEATSSIVADDEAVSVSESKQLVATFLTTLAVFGIFFGQGILIARILGPLGRGEFGTAIFFPRDVLLYVGLLGGIEIVTRYATNRELDEKRLKYSAATLGLFSGLLTAVVGALLSVIVLLLVENGNKAYLIPYCLLVCCFVPWEHIHFTVSGVDRGRESYTAYNINRLILAASFPLLIGVGYLTGLLQMAGQQLLLIFCGMFLVSRIVGLLPTLRGLSFTEWLCGLKESTGLFGSIEAKDEQPSAKELLKEGGPYALSALATEMFERLDLLLILALATVEESGFYFVAIPAAALLTIAPNSLAVFTFNVGADNRSVKVSTAIGVIVGTFLFQLLSLAILWFLIPFMVVLFFGSAFEPTIQFVHYLLPAFAIKGLLQALDGYLKGVNRPMVGVWARLLSIFAMLTFVYFSYDQFGLLSIPMAAFVGQFLSMLIVTFFVIQSVVARQGVKTGGDYVGQ